MAEDREESLLLETTINDIQYRKEDDLQLLREVRFFRSSLRLMYYLKIMNPFTNNSLVESKRESVAKRQSSV
jgi:hypothetical protein